VGGERLETKEMLFEKAFAILSAALSEHAATVKMSSQSASELGASRSIICALPTGRITGRICTLRWLMS
jgi:hypothetical protein